MLKEHRFKVLAGLLVLAALLVAFDVSGDFTIGGKLGVGTESPAARVDVRPLASQVGQIIRAASSQTEDLLRVQDQNGFTIYGADMIGRLYSDTNFVIDLDHDANQSGKRFIVSRNGSLYGSAPNPNELFVVKQEGLVGVNNSSPSATLDVHGSNDFLLKLTNESTGQQVLSVDKQGNMSSNGLLTAQGGADVAERIDATEALEPGDVVEIDPEYPGKFRKAREGMSHRVAGVISTMPGITLANKSVDNDVSDDRPLLALAGRVPVKATAKYGSIKVGDLLVSSAIPGYAMKCTDSSQCIGAIIGKALEPLETGTGLIEIQVALR